MNLEALKASLTLHEGDRAVPYQDSLGVWTVGIGHNMSVPLSDAVRQQILSDDIQTAVSELNRAFPAWTMHNEARQTVLAELMFNLGAPRLAKFIKFWSAMAKTDYETAAKEMMLSTWAVQTGQRAVTLSSRMREG